MNEKKCECGIRHKKKQVWEIRIPKSQARKLSVCPHCKIRFFYWQIASKHCHIKKHYGYYGRWWEMKPCCKKELDKVKERLWEESFSDSKTALMILWKDWKKVWSGGWREMTEKQCGQCGKDTAGTYIWRKLKYNSVRFCSNACAMDIGSSIPRTSTSGLSRTIQKCIGIQTIIW